MKAAWHFNRDHPFVSYAGNLEDVMLNRAFPQDKGFYVDIGAHDPVGASNTWALYERGWSGIAIDPLPDFCLRFAAKRPRDTCLNIAVGETDGETTFFMFGEGIGHSTCDRDRADALRREFGEPVTEIKVPVRTLGSILAEYGGDRTIDIVSIDAEGAETAILQGARLDRFRPKLILIEAMAAYDQTDISQEASKFLEQNGYVLGYEDGLNKFFVAREYDNILKALRYPPNLFDHFVTASEFHVTSSERDLRRKSRRRLRLLQIALVAWGLSVVGWVASMIAVLPMIRE